MILTAFRSQHDTLAALVIKSVATGDAQLSVGRDIAACLDPVLAREHQCWLQLTNIPHIHLYKQNLVPETLFTHTANVRIQIYIMPVECSRDHVSSFSGKIGNMFNVSQPSAMWTYWNYINFEFVSRVGSLVKINFLQKIYFFTPISNKKNTEHRPILVLLFIA